MVGAGTYCGKGGVGGLRGAERDGREGREGRVGGERAGEGQESKEKIGRLTFSLGAAPQAGRRIYLRASGSGRQPQRRMARLQMSGHYAYPAVRSDVTPAPHFCPRATAAGSLH